jgi:hypothetical protein
MCNCSNFSDDSSSNFSDDGLSNFSHESPMKMSFDGENDGYDNFLTKKGRERRKLVKEGKASGLSSKDAKKEALASLPRAKLNELIGKIRNGENLKVIETPLGDVVLDSKVDEKLNELSGALDKENVDGDGGGDDVEKSFFEANKMYIIGAIVLIGGFIVYKKFIAKG